MARRGWDFLLFLLILAIGSISFLTIFSINKNLASNQLIFWIAGLLTLTAVAFFDFRNWQRFSWHFYFVTIVLLFLLLLVGDSVRGSVRWINLGDLRIQPSEIAKVSTIAILATFYQGKSAKELKNLAISFLLVCPAIILVLIQPDIGNALSFFAIWLGITLVSGFRPKDIFASILIVAIFSLLLFRFLAPYQKDRIKTFINPAYDPLGTGYQIIQSKIAVGSGLYFGRGLGQGSQSQLNFLPEAESDFIFASIAEQLGLLGAGLLIILYTLFMMRIFAISEKTDRFGRALIAGAVAYFILQFFINIGMNMGIVPVTGITLPLVSYGGSSLVSTLFLLGIVFSVRRLSIEA